MTAALAAAAPARAQTTGGDLEGFHLPSSTETPSEIQGPITPSHPIVERPVVRPAPAPAPANPARTAPAAEPEPAAPAQAPAASSKPAAPKPEAGQQARTDVPEALPDNGEDIAEAAESAPAAPEPPAEAPPPRTKAPAPAAPAPAPAEASSDASGTGSSWWHYLFVFLLLIPMGVAGVLFWRHNHGKRERVFVLPIERPKPRAVLPREVQAGEEPPASPALAAAGQESEAPSIPLRHALETTSLSVTLVNAILSYQLTLTNTSRQMIRDIVITGDLVSAHSSLSVEEQLAGPNGTNGPLHRIDALLPGQSTFLTGQLRLPIGAIHPLRREQAILFVPLARLRIEAEGLDSALVQTCVVGQRPAGPGAGLRPFRLDTGPRIYAEIGQRTLDVPAAA
ncbi:MAG: hypothetical protein PHE36_06815 [Novosphingobium sp.]|nr:hypothetical protein [Novosphingobium sp.]